MWRTGRKRWHQQYRGWSALRKLEYVDLLMKEIAGKKPVVRFRLQVDPLSELSITLGQHYQRKRHRYGADYPDFYDRDLKRFAWE